MMMTFYLFVDQNNSNIQFPLLEYLPVQCKYRDGVIKVDNINIICSFVARAPYCDNKFVSGAACAIF